MKRLVCVFMFVLLVGSVSGLTLPDRHDMVFLDIPIAALPDRHDMVFLDGPLPSALGGVNMTIVDNCGTTTIFHNQELNCTFNATYGGVANEINWTVNDSRVDMISLNLSGQVFDNPSLSDYNLPGCWDVTVTADGGDATDTATFIYCIDNSPPTFNETIVVFNLFNTDAFFFLGNWTDNQTDNATLSTNCTSQLNISLDNTTKEYNLSRAGDANPQEGTFVCLLQLTDSVLQSNQSFLLNLTINPALIPDFFVTNNSNITKFHYSGNTTDLTPIFDATFTLYSLFNMTTLNVTSTNAFLNVSNNDSKALNCQCNLTGLEQGLQVNVSTFFSGVNSTNITASNTLVAANISAGDDCLIFPRWNFFSYNATLLRNDSTTVLSCGMAVP